MAGLLATPPPLQQQAQDELEYLAGGTLERRRDGTTPAAAVAATAAGTSSSAEPASRPARQFVFRQNADYDSLIEACSRKLMAQPSNVRALMIRANAYVKKGGRARCAGR